MPDVCLQLRSSSKLREYRRMFDLADRSGFNGVEIHAPSADMDLEKLNLLSMEYNLPVRSIVTSPLWSPMSLLSIGKNDAYDELKPDIMVVPVPFSSIMRWPVMKVFSAAIRSLKRNYGKEKIAIENSFPSGFPLKHPVLDIKKLRDFCYQHDVFINFDLSNCAASGMDVLLSFDMLVPRIKNIHFSDYGGHTGNGHLFPGFGLLPLGMFLSRLNEYRYKGMITLEIDHRQAPIDTDDQVMLFREMIGFIKSYFQ
jgi:sugar phosphate isomerase/epimerase